MSLKKDPATFRHRERRRLPRRWNDPVFGLRRRYVYGLPAFLLLVFGLFGLWAFWLEPSSLVVRVHTIPLDRWPAGGGPLRVACIGDIHGGSPYIDRAKIQALVKLTNRQKPDLVVLLGDYVILGVLGGHFMEPEEVADALRGFDSPLGVYAVLGNHDWWYNGPRMAQALTNVGYRVLQNENVTLSFNGHPFHLVGLEDEWTRRPDVLKVLSPIPAGEPTIVITHNPDVFPKLPPVNGVTLSAHTHGGQVRLPFMGAPIVPSRYRQRYVSGHVVEGDQQMFVTSGVGTSVLPIRFCVPPEVAVLTLAPPGGDPSPANPRP
ncbi:MAG: metallophosphoesterase [Elusimicrobia bacterium]|nr:metallophosphoesterase [Elusimicrobiota bacterium]